MRSLQLLNVLFFLFLTSCSPHRKNKRAAMLPHEERFEYTVRIDGVECRRCISNALHVLQYVHGLKDINCLCPKDHPDQAVFTFWAGAQKFSLDELMAKLAHDDFMLHAIRGTFGGKLVTAKGGTTTFSINGLAKPVVFLSGQGELPAAPESLLPVELEGTLIWSPDDKRYVFLVMSEPEEASVVCQDLRELVHAN